MTPAVVCRFILSHIRIDEDEIESFRSLNTKVKRKSNQKGSSNTSLVTFFLFDINNFLYSETFYFPWSPFIKFSHLLMCLKMQMICFMNGWPPCTVVLRGVVHQGGWYLNMVAHMLLCFCLSQHLPYVGKCPALCLTDFRGPKLKAGHLLHATAVMISEWPTFAA